jgi:hypothetical protein
MRRYSRIIFLVCVFAALGSMACNIDSGGSASPTPTPTATPTPVVTVPVTVSATVQYMPSPFTNMAMVNVYTGGLSGTEITTGLTVTVAGVACPYDAGVGAWNAAVGSATAGSSIALVITGTGINISESITVPAGPTVTQPDGSGSPYDSTVDLHVVWSTLTTPGSILVGVTPFEEAGGNGYTAMLPGTDTTFDIPGGTYADTLNNAHVYVWGMFGTPLVGTSYESSSVSSLVISNYGQSAGFSTIALP